MFYDKREDEERKTIFQNRIIYSLPVRLGFWNDDLAIQEEKNFVAAFKKEHCELLVQKTRKMFRNLLRPTVLAQDSTYVMYGQNYQIKAADVQKSFNSNDKLNNGLFVSGLITEREIDTTQHLICGCMITASNNKQPCVRNTLKIIGTDRNKNGQQVLYGEDVFLQIAESSGLPLYIKCENSTIDTFGEHLSLRLAHTPDIYCRFKFYYWNPQKRYETAGTTFSPNSRVIIQHTASGRNLVIESHICIPTFFGSECTVSCYTYRDSHKMDTAENFWKIIATPKSNTNLFVRAAKGENIPEELLF